MHDETHSVLENILLACITINAFGDRAAERIENHVPLDLTAQEKDELNRAFKLMHLTLDCVHPLFNFSGYSQRQAG
ncbi:hypothetical protein [Pseudomonas zeae]|uniref:hypothetical protein n=1 Tax=Pseudomonas zeae TaxID=2745510 RepID=UPI0039E094FF